MLVFEGIKDLSTIKLINSKLKGEPETVNN